MESRLQVGVVSTTHGLKGEVKVFPTTDDPARFRKLKTVLLDTGRGDLSLEVEGVKFFKQMVILKFRGLDDISQVERFRGRGLFVPRSDAVKLKKDEYFIADLMGLKVLDEDGSELGVLQEVIETGANDVYQIQMTDGRELLLPAIRQCVLEVDVEAGFMRVHVLDGLLD